MNQALGLLLALASSSFPSPAPAQDAPVATRVDDERAKELNRILLLGGGGAIRAKTRWIDDHWEYRAANQWATLPAGAVARATPEREVLAQANELERKCAKEDGTARAQLADWMLRNGLAEEGLSQLERVLERDADQVDALRLLRDLPLPINVPGAKAESLDDAIRIAATAPLSLQECAIAELERRDDDASVMAALSKAANSHSPRIRAFALLAMRRLDPKADIKTELQRSVLDGSAQVRLEAARALRDTKEEGVALPLIRALGSKSDAVRENAIEALGNMGFAGAIEPLVSRLAALSSPQSGGGWKPPASNIFVGRQVAYIQDYDVEVAQFASVADPQVNTLVEGSVLDVRVIGVWETSVAIESRKIRGALGKLAGEIPGNSNRSWLDWWEANKSRFGVKTPPRPTTTGSN